LTWNNWNEAGGLYIVPYSDELWKKAKAKCRLNAEEIEIAMRLNINPKSLMKNVPSPSQQWKAPVGVWLRELEAKQLKKSEQKQRRKAKAAAKVPPKSDIGTQ
jgi:hypothetical protein